MLRPSNKTVKVGDSLRFICTDRRELRRLVGIVGEVTRTSMNVVTVIFPCGTVTQYFYNRYAFATPELPKELPKELLKQLTELNNIGGEV